MTWSSGVFSRVQNWQTDKINGIKILAARMDSECDNFAQGINESLNKGGQNSPTADLPMGGFKHTGVGDAAARTSYASAGQLQDLKLNWAAGGGSVDNISATLVPAITTLTDGVRLAVRSTGPNTSTAPVFSPSGLTARTITKAGGQALVAGDTGPAGYELDLRYNLAGLRWELLNPAVSKLVEDNSITYAKLQDIPTDSLIGRDAAGTGDPTAITLDASLAMTGGNVLQRAALTGDITASAGGNATTLSTTGVSANPYGSASSVATFTVDAKGRLTAASSVAIAIAESQVTNLVTDLAAKQPLDAELTALAGLASASDQLPYFTGNGTAALTTFTATARTLLDDGSTATMRTTLGLVIGTDVQAFDAELAALAGLTSAADKLPYFTGAGTASTTTLSAFIRTVLDDADAATAAATLSVLPLAGGTLVGALTLSADPASALHAATKQYVDNIGSGIRVKSPVRVATTANGALATAYENGDTVDSVVLATGDRILLKDQSAGAENGIYTVNASGAPTRATDCDDNTEPIGALTFVTAGTVNAGRQYYMNTPSPITLGTTALTWVLYYQPQAIVGGAGLTATGSTVDVGTASSARIVVNADNIDLATTAVSANSYGSATQVATFTVDAYGRLTLAGNTTIAIAESAVTNLVSDLAAKQPLDATLTALAAVTTAADQLIYATGSDTFSTTSFTATGRSLVDDTSTANMRTTLGLVIGTDVQAFDQTLTALAAANWAANALPIGSGADTLSQVSFAANTFPGRSSSGNLVAKTITDFGFTMLGDASASAHRTTIGLVIGTDVQAFDSELAALAGLVSAADRLPYFTGAGTASLATFTAFGRTLVDDADAATARTTLGLVIGTDVQAYDAELAALAGLTSAADKLPYFTGSGTASVTTLSSFIRTVLDDADAATAAATLSVLALAGGTLTGELILADVNHVSTLAAGFRGAPVVDGNSAINFGLTHSGKKVYHNEVTARTWTIPANASVAFPIGTIILLDNTGNSGGTPGAITLNITTDTLRRGDGTAGTGSRTIGANRRAAIEKTTATEWVITGSYT